MSDSINLNDLFAQFETSGIFERFQQRSDRSEEADSNRNDRIDEGARNNRGQGRGQLRATLARRRRNTEAVQVEFTRRAQEARAARETEGAEDPERAEAPERAERPREDAQAERTSLRQRFQQAIESFRTANQPGQARGGGGGEARGAAPAAAGAARGNQERQGFQVGNPRAAIGRREEPRLDGIRMAASFQQTALGNALNQNQPPAARRNNLNNQGPLTQRQGANATGGAAQNAGGMLFGGGGANPTTRANLGAPAAVDRGFGGAEQQTQGPLARVQERFTNPGAPGTDNNPAPLAARAEDDRGGANPEPLTERAIPGERNAGAGANPAVNAQVTPDLLNANLGGATGPGADTGALAGGNALAAPADAGGPGVAPPPNPLIPDPTELLQNTPAAPPGAQNAVDTATGPAPEDVQGGIAPERGASNPALPEPEPIQTPAEEAAAIGTTQREAADTELRANVPRPILEPTDQDGAGRTPAGAAADADLRGGGTPQAGAPPNPETAAAPGNENAAQNPLMENLGAPEPTEPTEPTEAAGPAAPERTEGGGPGAAAQGPAGNAGAGAAANPEGAAPVVEGPENRAERSALEEALESRATLAYEQQQEETQTTEPNPGQTVTEIFVR